MIFVDTNYFLRFLVKDHEPHQSAAIQLFRDGATGKIKLCTSQIVWFELYWVLTSFYEQDKSTVITILREVLEMSFIEIEGHAILEEAITLFAKNNVDLEDAFNAVYAHKHGLTEFKTFDKKLNTLFASLGK